MTAHQGAIAQAPATGTTVLANARLVLAGEVVPGALTIADGLIAAIETGAAVPPGAIDCAGDYLSPGLIELHTDNLERHMQPRPGVHWPDRAAVVAHDAELASVGITTVFDALRVGSVVSTRKVSYGRYARRMATAITELRAEGLLRISHFIHLRAETSAETLTEEIADFGAHDRIGILSLMDHTPGQRQFSDPAWHRTFLSRKYQMSDTDIDTHWARLLEVKATKGAAQERLAVERAGAFGAVLASHDDTTLEHVTAARANGVRLAEFPTTLAAARALGAAGIAVMMGAPNLLRGGSHGGNVAAGDLAAAGCLDILSSDYVPSSLLAAAVRLGEEQGDMAAGLARVTRAPAAAAGLADRGRLEPGLRADLIRFRVVDGMPVPLGAWVKGARVA